MGHTARSVKKLIHDQSVVFGTFYRLSPLTSFFRSPLKDKGSKRTIKLVKEEESIVGQLFDQQATCSNAGRAAVAENALPKRPDCTISALQTPVEQGFENRYFRNFLRMDLSAAIQDDE
ncbi:hypothetical protein Y032_0418g1121 [Ancylostoma ceylanicum]|uniref:Uncharacterized protein n=1 Tax=Ancylostoma ceylanicum TaxID=53326 RepID=A0A016X1E7_9BILA|nr:hypothetical protein Y032_0418g1121 [Ancylostoma ceylanicum]